VYQTDGGFNIESFTDVLAVYSPQTQAVTWFDYQLGVCDFDFTPEYCPPLTAFDFVSQASDVPALSFLDGQSVIPEPLGFEVLDLQAFADHVSNSVGTVAVIRDRVIDALRFYRKRISRIVGHEVTLLAGRPFLIPQSTQEAINALARDDIDHFETIALAREHSPLYIFPIPVQGLKTLGRERWSKWLSRTRNSKNSRSWLAACAISADLSASFGIGLRRLA